MENPATAHRMPIRRDAAILGGALMITKQFAALCAAAALTLLASNPIRAEIVIGVTFSTTGPAASIGIPNKNALTLAPGEIAGEKIRYVMLDDGSDTTAAVTNVKKLVSEQKIDLLLGPSITPTSLAVLDIVSEAQVPMISFGSAAAIVEPVDARRYWTFKTTANDHIFNGAIATHMAKTGVKSVAIIAVDDAYGESNIRAFTGIAEARKIHITGVERFGRTDASANAQVLKAMAGNPDAIYIIAAGTPSAVPHVALIERGYRGRIYQSGGAANSDFLRVGGKAVEGGFAPASPVLVAEQLPRDYPTRAAGLEFAKAYEAKFGPRSAFAPFVWDAMLIVARAIPIALKSAKPGTPEFRKALRDAIEGTRNLVGASAIYNMSAKDHSGVDQRGMSIVKIENGAWKLADLPQY
jgi:branched-chain amino acid transport system substrate-binding protein